MKSSLACVLLMLLFSCHASYHPVTQHVSRIAMKDSLPMTDSSELARYLQPFHERIRHEMSEVIGEAGASFSKKRPGGSLGNLIADAMFTKAFEQDSLLSLSICNYGGIRMNELMKGQVTLGNIYELLPFENELVILQVHGDVLQQWLNHLAADEGWPLHVRALAEVGYTSGRLEVSEKQVLPSSCMRTRNNTGAEVVSCFTIRTDSVYHVATNDYIAMGGDQCAFLKNQPARYTHLLLRDVLISYIRTAGTIQPDPVERILFRK